MTARALSVLLMLFAAIPSSHANDRDSIQPTKTWDLVVPGDKEPEKLPFTGTLHDNWDLPDKVKNGYLTTKEQLTDLWKALGQKDPLPSVDFAKETVVLIQMRAPKVQITMDEDKPILSFAIAATKPGTKERRYTMVTFPKESVDAVIKAHKK